MRKLCLFQYRTGLSEQPDTFQEPFGTGVAWGRVYACKDRDIECTVRFLKKGLRKVKDFSIHYLIVDISFNCAKKTEV